MEIKYFIIGKKVYYDKFSSTNVNLYYFNSQDSSGSVFQFGEKYELVIQPIVMLESDGEMHEIELNNPGDYIFNLRKLSKPTFNVRSSVYGDDSYVEFTVTIYDTWKVITTADYYIQIYNSAGEIVTPEEYQNVRYSINDRTKKFKITDINSWESYTLYIYYTVDMANNNTEESMVSMFSTRIINSTGIDVGEISSAPNSIDPSKIELRFMNSSKLTRIDRVTYTVYNEEDGTTYSGDSTFVPVEITIGGNVAYKFILPDISLTKQGLYLIQLQFSSQGTIVSDTSIEHIYYVAGG